MSATPPESENPDTVMRNIRIALAARDLRLRTWATRWAKANGRAPQAVYESARSTMKRHLTKGLSPKPGSLGEALVEALRADLGAAVVPFPADDPRAAPATTDRRRSQRRTGPGRRQGNGLTN